MKPTRVDRPVQVDHAMRTAGPPRHDAAVTVPPDPAHWLTQAVFYEIYPQSFADSGGDGIGDFPGALARLDHLEWLGVNTIWFNPCFASPFTDAGYDVADYLQVAPRYGSNDDLVQFVAAARERGIRVLLDLVAGHTSTQHPWFVTSAADPADDRYIWSDVPGPGFVASPGRRPGYYLKNFYETQPALNFGYARLDPSQPWRQPVDAPGPLANRAALREIMAFWLDRGVAGFRVDSALSLVKDDPGYLATIALWRELREWLDHAYPDAVIIPEGVEPRTDAAPAFHADFFLVIHEPHSSLFNNGGAGRLPWIEPAPCFFDTAGAGSTDALLGDWQEHEAQSEPGRPVLLASADHDFSRMACGSRTADQLGVAFAFLLSWPSVPSIYYGDEIGMRYLPGMPDVEGAVVHPTYNRAGARTPMQWDDGPNAGFSSGPPERLYLPVDPATDRPTVAAQLADEGSLLHLVRRLIALRRSTPALGLAGSLEVLHAGYPFVYLRGGTHLVVLNPSARIAAAELPRVSGVGQLLVGAGVTVTPGAVRAEPFGYAVVDLGHAGRTADPLRCRAHRHVADASARPGRTSHGRADREPGEADVRHPTGHRRILLAATGRLRPGDRLLGPAGVPGRFPRVRRANLDGYLNRIVEHDFPAQDHPIRDPSGLLRWLTAYAAATATTASYETIRDAATAADGRAPARSTTGPYREVLAQLWIVDPIPAWAPTLNRLSRLGGMPKHHLADPALAARLLGADVDALLQQDRLGPPVPRDGPLLGKLFESLVTLGVRVFAQAAEARVGHFRTHSGAREIDLIVERADHRVVAIEVKLGATVEDKDVRHLNWLAAQLGPDLLDSVIDNRPGCVPPAGRRGRGAGDAAGAVTAGQVRPGRRIDGHAHGRPCAPIHLLVARSGSRCQGIDP
jgi:alpha-glucosidase